MKNSTANEVEAIMKGNKLCSIMVIAMAVFILGIYAQPARAQLPGAIFTTLLDGTRINANIYEYKEDVYLDGGPPLNAPAGAAALMPGDYYFQVTDPSGKKLLSEDPVKCRRFTVSSDGVIVAVGEAYVEEKIKGQEVDVSCQHAEGIDVDHAELGAITVQLMPYRNTTNRGGVYKVWVTPVDQFVGDPGLVDNPDYFHGFVPRWSKTDNYKVRRKGPPCEEPRITVRKFKDCNANGVWDDGEEELNWNIWVTNPHYVTNTFVTPLEDYIALPKGSWEICEDGKPNWSQTALIVDGEARTVSACAVVEVEKECAGETHEVIFGNIPLTCITACKFYDRNADGEWDEVEGGVVGFAITLDGINVRGELVGPITKLTGDDGCVKFYDLLPGTYTVAEELPPDSATCVWRNSTPALIEVVATCDGTPQVVEFGNYAISYVDFGTKGYWHNKNGLAELVEPDRVFVNSLLPYSSPSSYFDAGDEPFDGLFADGITSVEAAFNNDDGSLIWGAKTWQAEVSHFLIDSNAGGDPREQLAQQLLAFIFNVLYRIGGVDGLIIINNVPVPAEILIAEAIAVWESGSATEQNAIQEQLNDLNESDAVPVVLPVPCEVVYPLDVFGQDPLY